MDIQTQIEIIQRIVYGNNKYPKLLIRTRRQDKIHKNKITSYSSEMHLRNFNLGKDLIEEGE